MKNQEEVFCGIPEGDQWICEHQEARSSVSETIPWNISILEIEKFWQRGITGKGVLVGILDTGLDDTHEDLKNKIDREKSIDFTGSPNGWRDVNSHGSHCGGTVAAEKNQGGVVGVAHDATLVAIKVLSDSGGGRMSDVAKGIRHGVDVGCHILNLSLGAPSGHPEVEAAIDYANSKGVYVVTAAGNSGEGGLGYPGEYDTTFNTAAYDKLFNIADFSSKGDIDFAAPGVSIPSTIPNNEIGIYSGTSMGAPNQAGYLALYLSYCWQNIITPLPPMEMKAFVESTAIDMDVSGYDRAAGHGRYDLDKLMPVIVDEQPEEPDSPSDPEQPEVPEENKNPKTTFVFWVLFTLISFILGALKLSGMI